MDMCAHIALLDRDHRSISTDENSRDVPDAAGSASTYGALMRRRTWYPALAVSISVLALCGCGTGETDLGGTAHQGPEGCGTIRLHGAPARSIAFHVGYVAEPGFLTVPDILRWYACVARPDGHVVALADGSFDDVDYFSWSPDGDSVLFAAARRDWQIYRSPVNGGRPTSLTPAGHSQYSPAVSPDGTLIAYTESTTRDSVWMMENDGSDRRQLTPADGSRTPVWSSDGRQLAFIRGHQLWLLDVGNGRRRELDGQVAGSRPAWSPDGRWIAYAGAASDLRIVSPRDGRIRRLGPHDPRTVTTMRGGSPPGALTAV